jgi:hypothetical protein
MADQKYYDKEGRPRYPTMSEYYGENGARAAQEVMRASALASVANGVRGRRRQPHYRRATVRAQDVEQHNAMTIHLHQAEGLRGTAPGLRTDYDLTDPLAVYLRQTIAHADALGLDTSVVDGAIQSGHYVALDALGRTPVSGVTIGRTVSE